MTSPVGVIWSTSSQLAYDRIPARIGLILRELRQGDGVEEHIIVVRELGRCAIMNMTAAAMAMNAIAPSAAGSGTRCVVAECVAFGDESCVGISFASAERLAGSFARQRMTSAAMSRGTSGFAVANGAGASLRCAAMSRWAVVCAATGCVPVSSSYAMTPLA